ncbi:hypothetical protein JYT16_02495 [Gemmatimonas aurantiaca]|nr:hypothetical protein [Gemmatimonas aurantiaca]
MNKLSKSQPSAQGETVNSGQELEDPADRAFIRAIKKSVEENNASAIDLFGRICDYHRTKLSLVRATLFIVSKRDRQLKSFALWDQGSIRAGVMVHVPRERSAFYELLEAHCNKTFSPAACFNGSLIEEKLSIVNNSGALLLSPLYCDGVAVGMIAFNSSERRPFAESKVTLETALAYFANGFASQKFLKGA